MTDTGIDLTSPSPSDPGRGDSHPGMPNGVVASTRDLVKTYGTGDVHRARAGRGEC